MYATRKGLSGKKSRPI